MTVRGGERAGHNVDLLEHLMAGAKAPAAPILIPPMGIVTRRSTDVLAINDSRLVAGVPVV